MQQNFSGAMRRNDDDGTARVRLPGESESYREARKELLEAEIKLRRNLKEVAACRPACVRAQLGGSRKRGGALRVRESV